MENKNKFEIELIPNESPIKKINVEKKPLSLFSKNKIYSKRNLSQNETRVLVGLKNVGNSCYISSIIQCLSNSSKINGEFLKLDNQKQNNLKLKLLWEFINIIKELWTSNTKNEVEPKDFKTKLGELNEKVNFFFLL